MFARVVFRLRVTVLWETHLCALYPLVLVNALVFKVRVVTPLEADRLNTGHVVAGVNTFHTTVNQREIYFAAEFYIGTIMPNEFLLSNVLIASTN